MKKSKNSYSIAHKNEPSNDAYGEYTGSVYIQLGEQGGKILGTQHVLATSSQERRAREREMRMGIMGYNQGKSPSTPYRATKRLLLTQNLA